MCLQESISQSCVSSGSSLVDQWQPPPRGFMPYPHPEPLSPQLSTADLYPSGSAHTPFCLSLCGVSGSWCAQGLFQPSESLWQEWGLILNAILPLLPSCCGFPLPLDVGYLLKVSPAPCSCCPSRTGAVLSRSTVITPKRSFSPSGSRQMWGDIRVRGAYLHGPAGGFH